jgi:thiol-disulfide isomerase/thioredoxin
MFASGLAVLGLIGLTTAMNQAPVPRLVVGSPAPALEAYDWVRGTPIRNFARGHVYVLEFWATWCGPCISSAPHLSELQRRYGTKDLTVIGITQLDRWGSTRSSIEALLDQMGPKMNYSIAIDPPTPKAYLGVFNGPTEWAYLGKAQVQSIPCTFVVGQEGKVDYIGLPTLVDETLEKVMAGRYDLQTAATSYVRSKQTETELTSYLDLFKRGRYKEAYALGWRIVAGSPDMRTVWLIAAVMVDAEPKGPVVRDLRLALFCAKKAVAASNERDPGMLMTLASVYYYLHKQAETDRLMRAAISLAEGDQKEIFRKIAKIFRCPI